MKTNIKTKPESPIFKDHKDIESYLNLNRYFNKTQQWFESFERELRNHYKEYKELVKPPEDNETWHCLQYLELLIEEILGDTENEFDGII